MEWDCITNNNIVYSLYKGIGSHIGFLLYFLEKYVFKKKLDIRLMVNHRLYLFTNQPVDSTLLPKEFSLEEYLPPLDLLFIAK
jgi:hypothetical protein